jgi:hypothetical protein
MTVRACGIIYLAGGGFALKTPYGYALEHCSANGSARALSGRVRSPGFNDVGEESRMYLELQHERRR